MLVCFGVSWPFNIVKSLRSRTAKGKSVIYEILAVVGYFFGLAAKIILGDVNYVMIFYIVDILMVTTDIFLTFRNRRLDRERDG